MAELKEKVVSTAPEGITFVKDALLLIHKGKVVLRCCLVEIDSPLCTVKILEDAETLKDAQIEDGSFCVAMQRKPQTTKKAKPAAVTGQPSTAPVTRDVLNGSEVRGV